MRKEKARIDCIPLPKKLQDIIPVKTIYKNGIFRMKNGRWSVTYRIRDINYQAAGKEEKKFYAEKFADVLSSYDSEIMYELTVLKNKLDAEEYRASFYLEGEGENKNLKHEFNGLITDITDGTHSMQREIYLTMSTDAGTAEAAKKKLDRAAVSLRNSLGVMDSAAEEVTAAERLEIINDLFNNDKRKIKIDEMMGAGRDVRTYICPESFRCEQSHIKYGRTYARVLAVKDISSYIRDDVIDKIIGEVPNPVMFTITSDPVPTETAVEDAELRLMKINKNADAWKRTQSRRHMPYDEIPYDLKAQREEVKKYIDSLKNHDMRLMYTTMTLFITAESEDELDRITENVIASGRTAGCRLTVLHYRQYDGLQTALPWGLRLIDMSRTLLSGSQLAFMPFFVEEVRDRHGTFYGRNRISGHLIMADETKLNNANMMILAIPGSGKSVFAKLKLLFEALRDAENTDFIIIDPEREYAPVTEELGGEVIKISADSGCHINLMDINEHYGIEEEKPVTLKSQFILSVFEHILDGISPAEKTIIDRCVISVYRTYAESGYKGDAPTFTDLYEEIKSCTEPEARDIALAMELFVKGSLNTFAQKTNVDTDARVLCYDLYDMDAQLMPVGLEVVLDNIINRVTKNRWSGRKTVIIVEELHMYLKYQYSADFFYKLWKRIRKCNGYCVGITQNVKDLMSSDTARTMLSNSELVVLLKQAEDDLEDIRTLCRVSEEQLNYVRNPEQGAGILKIGKNIIPFSNRIPADTGLYRLVNTDGKRKETM